MNRFRFLVLSLTALMGAATMFAADATGTWTGTLSGKSPSGEDRSGPAHMVLKQEGAKLTGTAGPDSDRQHEIQNGKVDNDTVSFDIPMGEAVAKVVMKLAGDDLQGQMEGKGPGGETMKAALTLKRAK